MSSISEQTTATDDLLDFPPARAKGRPIDPPLELAEIQRSECPIRRVRIWDGSTPWLITKYHDYRKITADQRFSADKSRPGFPLKNAGYVSKARTFLTMDDPEHLPYRRLWARHLSAKRMEALRPRIQEIVDKYIDKMLAGPKPVDFIEAFALPVPAEIMSELFGVPMEDRLRFLDLASIMSSSNSTKEDTANALVELRAYAETLVAAREAEPRDDLITRFLEDGVGGGVMTREELVNSIPGLVTAAHDTSTAMIALGTLALFDHPDQLKLLQENDDPKFIANATEELLRFVAPTQTGRRRLATADIEVGGQLIRAGEGVIAMDNQSSRDPDIFPDPDRLDLTRKEARRHNALGYGTHQCAGQSLARVELQVVYGTLYKRIPTLRLAVDRSELPFREDLVVYLVDRMPVTW